MTQNEFTLKDSFETADKIRGIPSKLFDDGYVLASFDVVSLFTNVPLKRTISIIIKRIYTDKLIETNLSKRSLRKLIKDTCTKTVFSANNILYEQLDGVSMGSSLGPVLANIIMTELENVVIRPLIDSNVIKFYRRYVDDTLLLLKANDVDKVHRALEKFDKNLKFTVDTFDNVTPHFLDLEIAPDGLTIFRKDTNTGLYTNFDSYAPWSYKKAWLTNLVKRASKICSANKLPDEIKKIKLFASWNNFPQHITNSIIHYARKEKSRKTETDDNVTVIWLCIPYAGTAGDQLIRSLKRKLKFCFKKSANVKFNVIYTTHKVGYYTNMKDKTPTDYKSNIVYKFTCPGCCATYIGKTERNHHQRCKEHATTDTAVHAHIEECPQFKYINNLLTIEMENVHTRSILINQVQHNTVIIDSSNNWLHLLIKEALYIKRLKPSLNHGLKASRELYLF